MKLDHLISFAKNGSTNTATPLKIKIDGYEISVAGDDSCGVLDDFSRTDLRIYKDNEAVFEKTGVTLQDIVDAVQWIKDQSNVILTIEDAKRISSKWKPNFEFVSGIHEVADSINKPHEDYPDRVSKTERCIEILSGFSKEILKDGMMLSDCMTIHSYVMDDLRDKGSFRTNNVKVGSHIPPDALFVRELAENLFPLKPKTTEELIEWYSLFQTIHPFSDGNGRVGGIIVAFWSYLLENKFLAPKQ